MQNFSSPLIMTLLENLISITSAVSRSLARIISYLPLVDSYMWHFRITIFVALNSSRQKSTFTFFEVVKFLAWISHVVFYASFVLSFDVSLPIKIAEMLLLSNRIRKHFKLPFRYGCLFRPVGLVSND